MEGRLVRGQIGVIAGGGPLASGAECSPEIYEIACDVGQEIATNGFALVCGGLGGVMPKVALWPEAACRGAKKAGGVTIGLVPTSDNRRWPFGQKDANPYCDLVIPTGLGHARNVLVVHASDALIAVDGETGTLSEIAIALKPEVAPWSVGKPIVGIKTWDLEGRVPLAESARTSVAMLSGMLR
jgi:uncharacterized protein (TIGR00725 family)